MQKSCMRCTGQEQHPGQERDQGQEQDPGQEQDTGSIGSRLTIERVYYYHYMSFLSRRVRDSRLYYYVKGTPDLGHQTSS